MPRQGPPHEFESEVLTHLKSAYGLARVFLRKPEEAEDAVQEACLKALEHFDGYEGRGGGGKPWLLAIVRNVCLSRLRRPDASGKVVHLDEVLAEVERAEARQASEQGAPTAEEVIDSKRDQLRVQRALARLPAPFREVVVLREIEDLSYQEIATVTGLPIGTVMSRLARGRSRLRSILVADTGGERTA